MTTGVLDLSDYATSSTAGSGLNSAIAALPSTGGTIVVPEGDWTLDETVEINKNGVVIEGVSPLASRLFYNPASVTTAIKNINTTQRFCCIRDLFIDSNGNGGTAIDASYFVNSQFERLRIGDGSTFPLRGIVFDGLGTYYNTVRDCRIQVVGSGSYGILFDNDANSNWVENVRILGDSNTVGVRTAAAHTNTLAHIDCETTMAIGLRIRGNNTTVISPYLEDVTVGLQLESGTEAFSCIGGHIADCTTNINDLGALEPAYVGVWLQYSIHNSISAGLNGMDPVIVHGRKSTAGAPTTGTWPTGALIMDSNKVLWFCTVGGTPGTWV